MQTDYAVFGYPARENKKGKREGEKVEKAEPKTNPNFIGVEVSTCV